MEGEESKPVLFGLGNTFIDWYAVAKHDLLDKYGLAFGVPGELTADQRPVLEDLEALDGYQELPGGSSLNTVRAFNYLMKKEHGKEHTALYFGAIGTDSKGEVVK